MQNIDTLVYIFQICPLQSIGISSLVCKLWNSVIEQENFWKLKSLQLLEEYKNNENLSEDISNSVQLEENSNWKSFCLSGFLSKTQIHFFKCHECGQFPIIDVRYECYNCSKKYICCENCENKLLHPPEHLLMKMYSPTEIPLKGYEFPVCGCSEPKNEKFHCIDCDVIFCESCSGDIHLNSHKVFPIRNNLPIKTPVDSLGKNPRGAWCNACSTRCVGINWKCVYCFGTDFCYGCEKGRYHDLDHALFKVYWVYPQNINYDLIQFPTMEKEKIAKEKDLSENPDKKDLFVVSKIPVDPIFFYPYLFTEEGKVRKPKWYI